MSSAPRRHEQRGNDDDEGSGTDSDSTRVFASPLSRSGYGR